MEEFEMFSNQIKILSMDIMRDIIEQPIMILKLTKTDTYKNRDFIIKTSLIMCGFIMIRLIFPN